MRLGLVAFAVFFACGARTPVSTHGADASPFPCGQSVADDDGHTYGTTMVGAQCWMSENLNRGAQVLGATEQTNDGRVVKYCFGDDAANCDANGGLYQFGEATAYHATGGRVRGICPAGWHVPSDDEWGSLETTLGCSAWQNDLSSINFEWRCDGLGGTGNGLGGLVTVYPGHRHYAQVGPWNDRDLGQIAAFWTSTKHEAPGVRLAAMRRKLQRSMTSVSRTFYAYELGYSIRCVHD